MTHQETFTIFERFRISMENEMGPGKLVTYGIASAGLFIALNRIRPFTKFKKPSDVPLYFMQSRVPLQGTVMRVEPSGGALLMVNHHPLLRFLQFYNNKNYLPVKISGVDVTGNGISWLQSIVNGKCITFIPLDNKKDYLECIVLMSQKDQDSLKIGEELVRLGLGTIHEPWLKLKDKHILAYKKSLLSAQKQAVRKRNGYWHFVKQPTVLWKIQMFITDKIKLLLPTYLIKQLSL